MKNNMEMSRKLETRSAEREGRAGLGVQVAMEPQQVSEQDRTLGTACMGPWE